MKQIVLLSILLALAVGCLVATQVPNFSQEKLVTVAASEQTVSTRTEPINITGAELPVLTAAGILVFDETSGIALYSKNEHEQLLPASTTKIMTAYTAIKNYGLNDVITVPLLKVDGQKMRLFYGERMSVESLLYGLLVYSANDAAEVLAYHFPGGRAAFIDEMNRNVARLGLKDTHFETPTGLDADHQYSSAFDLAMLAKTALTDPIFARIVATKDIDLHAVDGLGDHKLKNVNVLLGTVPGVLGVKTGWTENARENLVTAVERNGHRVHIVLLGSNDRFGETLSLINWVYDNFEWRTVNYINP